MEEDPVFKEMVRRSFILRKAPDLEIPMVKSEARFKHHAATTLVLSTCIHLAIYPLDTLKTRLISRSLVSDLAYFDRNKVAELSLYTGILRGYGSMLIGNLCHLTIGRESLVLSAVAEGLLKTWIDMSKISKQMGNIKGDFDIMKKSFGVCAFYGVLRDVTFRTLYVDLSTRMHKEYMSTSKFYDERKRVNNIFISVILATLVSQPFEVCFVKAASQRSLKYRTLVDLPKQIIKEEGIGKMLVGGLWARLAFNILSTMILVNTYDETLKAAIEVM